MPADRERPTIRVAWSAITDVGRVRSHNEDAFVARDLDSARSFEATGTRDVIDLGARGLVLAVSDGMGGAQAGEVASALVLQTLQESLATSDSPTDESLRQAVEDANRTVFEAAKYPDRKGMGATLTALLLHGRSAYIASVGDSRAYLQRGSRFRRMTRDQSYVQVLVDAGVLQADEAESSPMKNIVLQSMGQKSDVQVALGRLELFRGDRLLVCSDGLTGHLKDPELAREIERRDMSLDQIARHLVEVALERGGEDNITVVIVELTGDGLARPEIAESVTQTYQVISEFEAGIGPDRRSNPDPVPAAAPAPATPLSPSPTPSERPRAPSSRPPEARSAPQMAMKSRAPGRLVVGVLLGGMVLIAALLAAMRVMMDR